MAQPGSNKSTFLVLAFMAGVVVGMKWPKIKKSAGPFMKVVTDKSADLYAAIATFLSEQKEKAEDRVAEMRVRKTKRGEGGSKDKEGRGKAHLKVKI